MELHYILKEFDMLIDSRVDNIYNNEKEEFYFQFHKSNVGKIILKVLVGKSVFISDSKNSGVLPSAYCQQLRKHLSGKFLRSIKQINSERILELRFESKSEKRRVYIEFFGSGNIILCDGDGIIINALTLHKFKDRDVLHKKEYKFPKFEYNFFKITGKELVRFFKDSDKDKVVTALATGLGFGGVYSEEVCLLAEVDKNIKPEDVGEKEARSILSGIKKIIINKNHPIMVYEDDEITDVVPFSLLNYENKEIKKVKSFSEGLEKYYLTVKPKRASPYDQKLKELERITKEQEKALKDLKNKEIENKEKAELVYHNYKVIEEIITEINKASKKHSWDEIRKKLKGHKIVKEINLKDKTVLVDI